MHENGLPPRGRLLRRGLLPSTLLREALALTPNRDGFQIAMPEHGKIAAATSEFDLTRINPQNHLAFSGMAN